ncbi:MAG TPA: rod-binding protein [Alphaproteobacteria bacterium]|nr:rod-binding protein [Alphaproteobacteria bacterium]
MNLNPDTSLALMQATQLNTANKADFAKQAIKSKDEAKIEAAAKDFEAMYISEMIKPMFEQIKPDPTFGGGKGEEIFRGLMIDEYGKLMAETGQLGIGDALKQEFIRLQEEASHDASKKGQELANAN